MGQLIKNPGNIPRLAIINDITGFGRCSTAVALPVVSVLKVQGCPVPTSILSNHLGFPTCYFDDYTPHMRNYVEGLEKLGVCFDGLYCGFLGSVEQIDIVKEMLESPLFCKDSGEKAIFLLDPVMGDHGKAYSTITTEHCSKMRELMEYADILTPNITEACLLTGSTYQRDGWADYNLEEICRRLAGNSAKKIVITGLNNHITYMNYIWENGIRSTYMTDVAGTSRPGTGDLFSSVLAAEALNGRAFVDSVKKASDFVALCIRGSEEAGSPIQEGVLFEKYLDRLLISNDSEGISQ